MSNDTGMRVWVGDLDDYIDIGAINASNKREAEREQLENELDQIGEINLFAERTTSAERLNSKGVIPADWRHALHLAEGAIGPADGAGILDHHSRDWESPERRFLRAMIDLGRPYAVARYARWEGLDYPSAITASLPHGIRALLNQFIVSEGIRRSPWSDKQIRDVLAGEVVERQVAYRRTGAMRSALHAIADEAPDHAGGEMLDRSCTRTILSLTRLHFSIRELKLDTAAELRGLMMQYVEERACARTDRSSLAASGRPLRAWRLRHVRPLLDLYPYSIRHGLARMVEHLEPNRFPFDGGPTFARTLLVNELALAHCGILRMRRAGRDRTRPR